MTILILENVPPSLRGEISKWLLEVQTNVFVGKISRTVRNLLWKMSQEKSREGNGTLIYSTNNEQGFVFETFGTTRRVPEDFDGLWLVRILNPT